MPYIKGGLNRPKQYPKDAERLIGYSSSGKVAYAGDGEHVLRLYLREGPRGVWREIESEHASGSQFRFRMRLPPISKGSRLEMELDNGVARAFLDV